MYISHETQEQTEDRLRTVIKQATLKVFPGPYCFKEMALDQYSFDPEALAIVRDDEVWSSLVPATTDKTENFKIFRFHFTPGLDNSGFVGWLASKIKRELGSGVFVVCGQNSSKGGIFDYSGCPFEMAERVLALINNLRS
jgi:hypothetical protein